jgi:hypothetical protein
MFLVLIKELDVEIAKEQDKWFSRDQELAEVRGLEFEEVEVEPIAQENFHLGFQPSLIEATAPRSQYPNVVVMSFQARPTPQDDFDQVANYSDRLYVETMVKASLKDGPEVADRRVKRTANAINNVVMRNRTLRGSTADIGPTPSFDVSPVFTRLSEQDSGQDWYWQAGRIDYMIHKFSPFE